MSTRQEEVDVLGKEVIRPEVVKRLSAKREADLNLIKVFGERCTLKESYILKYLWMNRSVQGRKKILWEACPEVCNIVGCFMNEPLDELHIASPEKLGNALRVDQLSKVVGIIRAGNLDKYR